MSMAKTERQQELVARMAALGPTFAERAGRYDSEASFPFENFDDLRDAGFLALCIPEEHGGLGADFATYALVAEELGRHCGSTALTFNMHTATMLLCGQLADDFSMSDEDRTVHEQRRAAMFRKVVEGGDIHAQLFSEGHKAGATAGVMTRAVAVEGGWRVTGRKIFASLADAAHSFNITCKVDEESDILFLGIPTDAEGVTVEGDWDPLGMRGTVSRTMIFDNVFVPADRLYLPAGCFEQISTRWPFFYMTLSFAFLGIQQAVLDFTGTYLRGNNSDQERRDQPQKQHGWGQLVLAHEQSQALTYRVISEAGVDPTEEQVRRAWAAMVTAMDTAPAMASLALRVCGGRALLRPAPLERIYRDARCGATMLPWSEEVCLDRLGKSGLYDDEDTSA